MFGYIMTDRKELKGKDLDTYRAFYCGVCRDLKAAGKERARLTLTYDMVFLAVLLTGLYEAPGQTEEVFCGLHPLKKQAVIRNSYTAYAADMNLLLSYHNLEDDWLDDRNALSLAASRLLRKEYLKSAAEYPRQVKAIRRYLRDLHRAEEEKNPSIDCAASLTGYLLGEIFVYQEDVWQEELRSMGLYLGRFIYLMDAWEDREKDRKSGGYNPFLIQKEAFTEDEAFRILAEAAASAARAFEKLPILEHVDILRNIMYSGIWVRYRAEKADKEKKTGHKIR